MYKISSARKPCFDPLKVKAICMNGECEVSCKETSYTRCHFLLANDFIYEKYVPYYLHYTIKGEDRLSCLVAWCFLFSLYKNRGFLLFSLSSCFFILVFHAFSFLIPKSEGIPAPPLLLVFWSVVKIWCLEVLLR